MLEPLYTAAEMRAAEEGENVEALMEKAGRAVADVVLEFEEAQRITVVCGGGNNGGDGCVAARILEGSGRKVRVVDAKSGDHELGEPDLIVDAIFGTGFSGKPREKAARLIDEINALGADVVAVDIPSGVDASTGEITGAAVDAAVTVTFHAEKVGHNVAPGAFRCGEIELVDIGLEDETETQHALVTEKILEQVPLRSSRDNKYSASVLAVGGAPGTTGAISLTAVAAFRADAGYVTVAAPAESLPVLELRLLEAVKRPLDEVDDAVDRARALALGPGLGRSEERQALVRRLLEETDVPAVVDADGLWELEPFEREPATVLTPHSGELARLLDVESEWVDAHRLEAVRRAVERFRCTVLLKGSDTVIGTAGQRTLIVRAPPSLATAGTGDVLTGVVAAFLAKGLDAHLAAAAAAQAHAMAAWDASQRAGLIASDVVEMLPHVFPWRDQT